MRLTIQNNYDITKKLEQSSIELSQSFKHKNVIIIQQLAPLGVFFPCQLFLYVL